MGRQQGSGAAGQAGSPSTESQQVQVRSGRKVTEVSVPGLVPRFEIPEWRERYGVVAGITGRGLEPGPGFDLGLWSKQPVGEVMSRWLAFRKEMAEFPAIALGNQVHGVEVMSLDGARGWTYVEGIDGWVTITPGTLLAVTVADCIPIYLLVPGKGVALLHAGWRGTAGGILERGLGALVRATGVSHSQVLMHCGVGICGDCYEVGPEVMTGCGLPADGSGPWQLDLRAHLADQARTLGVREDSVSGWCSAHHRPAFYSHRGSRGADGRMVAYIGMRVAR